jgi:hypothetical protein
VDDLKKVVDNSVNVRAYLDRDVCAADFYRFCEIGYDANGYFSDKKEKLTPKEKYLAMADGRDCKLRNIDENSVEEFLKWHEHGSHCGGHPWEICRGGNSTHISLYLHRDKLGWLLRLAGSSSARVVETVKMALALYKNGIPFTLDQAEEIFRMITGIDFIGIVPDTVFPRYCHSLFPKEDRIIDFMNLPFEKTDEVVKRATWYPIDKVVCLKDDV